MRMHARRAVRTHGNVADQRRHLDLLADLDRPIALRLPVEICEPHPGEGPDRRDLRAADALLPGECRQARHHLVASPQDNRKGPLAVDLVQQLASHRAPAFPVAWAGLFEPTAWPSATRMLLTL